MSTIRRKPQVQSPIGSSKKSFPDAKNKREEELRNSPFRRPSTSSDLDTAVVWVPVKLGLVEELVVVVAHRVELAAIGDGILDALEVLDDLHGETHGHVPA